MNEKFDPFALIKHAVFGLLGFAVLFGGFVVLLLFVLKKLGVREEHFRGAGSGSGAVPPPKRYTKTAGVLTKAEVNFYAVLAHAVYPELVVFPKVRVTDLINPVEHRYSSGGAKAWNAIAQKHVDFVLCHSASLEVAGIVELDDRSHDRADRQRRDQLVDQAFNDADLRILHVQCQASYSQPDTRKIILRELGMSEL